MNPVHTEWGLLINYAFVLFIMYLLVELLGGLLPRFVKRSSKRKRFTIAYKRFKVVFIIVAAFLLLLTFVRINYMVHGGFLVFLIVILFPFIRSLLHGVVIQLNGALQLGTRLETGTHVGEITKFTPLGLWLTHVQGASFINYLDVHKNGFTTRTTEDNKSRTHVLINTTLQDEQVIDLLFETPFINHAALPELKGTDPAGKRTLYFTLKEGVNQETLFAFLNQQHIEIVSKY